MLSVRAGPRDGEEWVKRLKEEYMALITVRMLRPPSAASKSRATACAPLILTSKRVRDRRADEQYQKVKQTWTEDYYKTGNIEDR